MQCTSPLWLEKLAAPVPCGRCTACRMARAREWAIRVVHELSEHKGKALFATLTYSDDQLPAKQALSKRTLQLFMKRLRKRLGKDRRIKYLACGEYREKYLRPHYHAIIFGLAITEHTTRPDGKGGMQCLAGPLNEAWPFGHIHLGSVTYQSARYTADYVLKTNKTDLSPVQTANPPFLTSSQGFGKAYALANAEQIKTNAGITMNGKNVGIPRYYKKILENTELNEELFRQMLLNRHQGEDPETWEELERLIKQEAKNRQMYAKTLDKKISLFSTKTLDTLPTIVLHSPQQSRGGNHNAD